MEAGRKWYLLREGQRYGPFSDVDLDRFHSTRQLLPNDRLWHEGLSEWQPSAFFELQRDTPGLQPEPMQISVPRLGRRSSKRTRSNWPSWLNFLEWRKRLSSANWSALQDWLKERQLDVWRGRVRVFCVAMLHAVLHWYRRSLSLFRRMTDKTQRR